MRPRIKTNRIQIDWHAKPKFYVFKVTKEQWLDLIQRAPEVRSLGFDLLYVVSGPFIVNYFSIPISAWTRFDSSYQIIVGKDDTTEFYVSFLKQTSNLLRAWSVWSESVRTEFKVLSDPIVAFKSPHEIKSPALQKKLHNAYVTVRLSNSGTAPYIVRIPKLPKELKDFTSFGL